MKETSKLSNAASQATWEVRAVGGHRSNQNKGEKQYFYEMKSYRYGYETPFIKDIFNFNNLKDKRVLEIGVGNGIDAMSMIENGAIYSGIDITANHLDLTKKNIDISLSEEDKGKYFDELIEGDITEINFPKKYDVIYSFGVLHHIEHELEVLHAIKDILEPKGELRFSVYAAWSFFSIYLYITWIFKDRLKHSLHEWQSCMAEDSDIDNPVIIKIRSKKEVINLLHEAGFEVLSYSRQGFVQGYIPIFGRFLNPSGAVLKWLASFLGWYHCITYKVK